MNTINREHLEEIRSAYADMEETESTATTIINADHKIKLLADKFFLMDDAENLAHLKKCIMEPHVELACAAIYGEYIQICTIEQRRARRNQPSPASSTISKIKTESTAPTGASESPMATEVLPHIICQILVKKNRASVFEFCQDFLLCPLAKTSSKRRMLPTNISILSDDLIGGPIPPGSTLDVFIRTQLVMRGGTIDAGRALTKLPLIEPIVLVDEFDTWYFDHLHGLFELNLVPQQQFFPRKWKLAPNVELYYLFEWLNDSMSTDQESAQTAKNVDRPSTVSLERFVEDVCEKENNGMAEEWIKALRTDHLFSYDHLVNLKYSEWDQLKQLPLNGRKILKSYVDREKQMATDTKGGTKDKKSDSNNDIRKQFLEVGVRPPAKLNAECVQLSFDEMRREGFADDGLFDQMKLFFLPLTMVEEDLAVNETRWKTISTRTGKSDIMSKLSIRMGINMVAPPLAAGELNRPLVGESERIISDICMRCHRIPYLMCCVSIDEIDSLAPKRKDDTSDGNVAKLSVLLSVIDGIKDVPNLMIFCATNRLHMMDDAFLRRMSGKFFVGRPSSHARKSILSGIKSWHMPPNLLDSLTMATTNFSGAALR
ncbi:unnamed protein product [Rotaria sp. Silwood1]|nr:unnamed protein product [Rotaria sp. Silwood1]